MTTTAQVRFMMENRKDLCKPEERARDLDNLERLRAARPLAPPRSPNPPVVEEKRRGRHG